jgi:hypothetical protein
MSFYRDASIQRKLTRTPQIVGKEKEGALHRWLDGAGLYGETGLTETDTVRIRAIANRDPHAKRAFSRIFLAEI